MSYLISPKSVPSDQISSNPNLPHSTIKFFKIWGKIISNMPQQILIRSTSFSGLVDSHSDKSSSQKVVLRYLTLYALGRPCKKRSRHIGAGIPSEISYWTFCASWQIHRGLSRGTPTLLCQIKQQYFAAKNGRF